MNLLRPYSTLLVGMALGIWVVPMVTRKLNVNLPGS